MRPLPSGRAWTEEALAAYDDAFKEIADSYRLDCYPHYLEIISYEQMIDKYVSNGLPFSYPHWSYGKAREALAAERRHGMGLAYEIVINSDPCLAYLMEDNSLPMQALVIAHAAYGHNSFFKGNVNFKENTAADGILDYLEFARNYVADCERRYGENAVSVVFDAAHALRMHGVDKMQRRSKKFSPTDEERRLRERAKFAEEHYDEVVAVTLKQENKQEQNGSAIFTPIKKDEDNLLYFLEKESLVLKPWQREILRIVRKIAQYFKPQRETKVMNEGWATFWHYTMLYRLHELGLVGDAFMLEFLESQTAVTFQPEFDETRTIIVRGANGQPMRQNVPIYNGLNPYALGFAMYQDIRRVAERPTKEDEEWFKDTLLTDGTPLLGAPWVKALDDVMRNYRDETFIFQFLSPTVMRKFKFFALSDRADEDHYTVIDIHEDRGYRRVREVLANQYNAQIHTPDIGVVEIDPRDNEVTLHHRIYRGWPLHKSARKVLQHFANLYGRRAKLVSVINEGGEDRTEEVCSIAPEPLAS